jgi:hypothetical protein
MWIVTVRMPSMAPLTHIATGISSRSGTGNFRVKLHLENARRRLAGDRLKISPARDLSRWRGLGVETCKKCPVYKDY